MSTPKNSVLVGFLVSTFVWTYAFWTAQWALVTLGTMAPGSVGYVALQSLGALGPTVFALVFAVRGQPKGSLGTFLRQWLPNPPSRLVVLVLALQIGLEVVKALVRVSVGASELFVVPQWAPMVALLPLMILGGGLEEPGWRGVVLDHWAGLRRAFLVPLLVMGGVWILWHLPLWFIPGTVQHDSLSFPVWALNTLTLGVLLVLVRLVGGSIGWCILSHAAANTMLGVFPPSGEPGLEVALSTAALVVVLLVALVLRNSLRETS